MTLWFLKCIEIAFFYKVHKENNLEKKEKQILLPKNANSKMNFIFMKILSTTT